MRKFGVLIIALILFSNIINAQESDVIVMEAMQKISVMVGEWEGDGWAMTPDRKKKDSHVKEHLQWKLDETLLLVEGIGKDETGKIVHNALGLIYYDKQKQQYGMRSHLATGQMTDASFEILGEDQFRWAFATPNGGQMRYSITISEKSKWNEIGEYSLDGQQWFKTFEMNLVKKNK